MYFSECGFTVISLFGYKLEIINRKRNPIMSSSELPVFQSKEFRIWKYGISFSKI